MWNGTPRLIEFSKYKLPIFATPKSWAIRLKKWVRARIFKDFHFSEHSKRDVSRFALTKDDTSDMPL